MRHLFLLLIFAKFCDARAQSFTVGITMPPVALVDLVSSSSLNFTLSATAPTEAGNAINTSSSNTFTSLILTSAVGPSVTRSIRGDVIGTLPPGIQLRLDVSAYSGSGAGFAGGNGVVTSSVYLTNSPNTRFIDNIKGAYTGIAATDGFKLKYSLEVQTYANIRSGTSVLTVRYTMTDN